MMSPTSKLDPQTAAGLPEQRPGSADASRCRFFRNGLAALCGLGLLVVSLTLWLAPDSDLLAASRRGVPAGGWVLQVLITGNLTIGLLWVWLDSLAWRRSIQPPETRGNLSLVALSVAACITFFCLILAGTQRNDEVLAMAMFLAFPTLAVMLPLLWGTVRRIESVRLGTLILVGFVAASALAQGRMEDSLAASGESLFVVNSYLIGLAVAVWLLSWAAFHEPPTGARTALSASAEVGVRADKAVRVPADSRFMSPTRDSEIVEATPEPRRTA